MDTLKTFLPLTVKPAAKAQDAPHRDPRRRTPDRSDPQSFSGQLRAAVDRAVDRAIGSHIDTVA